ncbi:hypothetical protein CPB85DRAFT_759426 [Mucidula mucida]|nr:hypothetical protein CPB85DRAFT_759426 [Mucidula mucida]
MGNGGAETFGLRAQRIALRASTTGHTVQMPVKIYHSTYHTDILPSVGETDELITWVDEELRAAGILDDSGWRDTKLSEDASEDATYKGLEPIAKKIVNLRTTWNKKKKKTKLPQPTTRLVCRPRLETKSEVRGGSMKTDARFILMKSRDGDDKVDDKKVKTCDVGGPMEAKLHLEDRGTNEDQIVGAVSHILYNDPSRRFVLAFTVEGNMMRFWYFSRSHITVSAEFDYHKNPGTSFDSYFHDVLSA